MTGLIDLSKKVQIVLEKKKIFGEKAQVVVAIDVSGSMSSRFRSGEVQQLITRLLAIGMNMDVDQSIDVFTFNTGCKEIGSVSEQTIDGYVENVLLKKTSVSGGTNYANVMEAITEKFSEPQKKGLSKFFSKKTALPEHPVFVLFITDGNNSDKTAAEKIIRDVSNQPIFWQFVGIGNETFSFLQKLDDLSGRFVDNANFFAVKNLQSMSDEALYDLLLNEFPTWLTEIRSKNLLTTN